MVLCPACGGEPESSPLDKPEVTQAVPLPSAPLPKREGSHASSDWQVGDVILDTYEVKGELGQGGFGKVYRVHHKSWNIDLAVKRSLKIEPESRQAFMEEAEKWVDLGLHPNIVSCYYVRTIDDFPHTFAELAEGGSLETWIRDGKLYEGQRLDSLKRILDIAIQFAWGLAYAHERGLVHQDVKPDNVLMGAGEVAKVTDFGLARARTGAGLTGASGVVSDVSVSAMGGTVAYMSPEQSAGQRLTLKTDLWSWGVSVLEMLLGERTWMSGVAALDALEDYASPGSELAAGAKIVSPPGQLVEILRQCFSYEPVQRPADMLEVAGRLQEIYRREVGQAYPRQLPKAAELRADSLNNKALSLLDLGQLERARSIWDEALQSDSHHLESIYNLGLIQWRNLQITDGALLEKLREASSSHPGDWKTAYLQALVHLERGGGVRAIEVLNSLQGEDAQRQEVLNATRLAKSPDAIPYRLVRTFEGHAESVTSVCLSADGRYALSGSQDKTLRLWHLKTGHCLRIFEGHAESVTYVCLSADGHYALSGSRDGSLKLWEVETGCCLRTFEGNGDIVSSVSMSADGRFALSGYNDDSLLLWDVKTGHCLSMIEGHTDIVTSVCLSADGRYALSGSYDQTLKLWDIASGCCLRTFEGHKDIVNSVCLSSDERYALSGGGFLYGKLILWDMASGWCLKTFDGHTGSVDSVFFSTDGRYVLSGGGDCTIKLWEVSSGRCSCTFEGHTEAVTSVCLSDDKQYVLSGSYDNTLKLWEVNWGVVPTVAPFMLSQVQQVQEALSSQQIFEQSLAEAQQLLAQGRTVEAARQVRQARAQPGHSQEPQALQLWQRLYTWLPHAGFHQGWKHLEYLGHKAGVCSVCLSADGRHGLSGSYDNTLKLWDAASGRCERTFGGHSSYVCSVYLSVDGRYALSGSYDKSLKLWEVETGRCLRTFEGHTAGVFSVCLSTDVRFALSGSEDGTLRLWDVASGCCLRTFIGHKAFITSVCLSADGNAALSGSGDKTLKLWETMSGRCLRTFKGHNEFVNSVCLSADGRCALSGSADGTLKLWEVENGRCLRTFEGHTAGVESVRLSADGRYALSGSGDNTLKLWDVETGSCLRTFEGHIKGISSSCLSADGRYALSGGDDITLKLWALDWELEDQEPADWDDGARSYLENFLTLHTPYAGTLPQDREPTEEEITLALTRRGRPTWTEEDFKSLLYTLGCAGYGWLRPEGVRRELERMAKERG
jgi:WD40 repeat protein